MGEDPAAENVLHRVRIPQQTSLFRFLVVWGEDDEGCECEDELAESLQWAVNAMTARMKCLGCGEFRDVEAEVAEIVI